MPLIVRPGQDLVAVIIGIGCAALVPAGLGYHISIFIIGINGGVAFLVRMGSPVPGLIIGIACFCAVRIYGTDGTPQLIKVNRCLISTVVRHDGMAFPICKAGCVSIGVCLGNHPAFLVIGIFHHCIPVFILPGSHVMGVIIEIVAGMAFRVCKYGQVSSVIVFVLKGVSIRECDLRNAELLIHGNVKGLFRGCDHL